MQNDGQVDDHTQNKPFDEQNENVHTKEGT